MCGACSSNSHFLNNLGKQARVCDNCYESLSGIPMQSKKTRRTSVAPKPKDSKLIEQEFENKATLAKRATMLLTKGTGASTASRTNVRKHQSVSMMSSLGPDDTEYTTGGDSALDSSEATDTLTADSDNESAINTSGQGGADRTASKSKSHHHHHHHQSDGDKSTAKRKKPSSKKSSGKKTSSKKKDKPKGPAAFDGIKALEDWTADEVECWFTEHENGKFSRFAATFAGVSGADIASLTEAQICSHVPGLMGSVVYNALKSRTRAGM